MVTVVTIDLEARRRQERRRNFYAFGVVTLFSALQRKMGCDWEH